MAEQPVIPGHALKILIASDTHLGFMERDKTRSEDTFESFKEILDIAVKNKVDFILLGGDLFDVNKPGKYTLKKTSELLHQFCYTASMPHPPRIKILNQDGGESVFNHSDHWKGANFDNPHHKITLPIFTIHGNHDDPVGKHNVSTVELFAANGLVNYIGKFQEFSRIHIKPLLIGTHDARGRPAPTKVAIYGFGAMPDARAYQLFSEGQVRLEPPPGDPKEWFKIFVIHQNRPNRGSNLCVPERHLMSMNVEIDLVIWGHEHEAKKLETKTNRYNHNDDGKILFVYQPGSSVITSLIPGETEPKKVGLMTVFMPTNEDQHEFKIDYITLESPRRAYMKELSMEEHIMPKLRSLTSDEAQEYCHSIVREILKEYENDSKSIPSWVMKKLPLVRLKIWFKQESTIFNTQIFATTYFSKVANPSQLLKFHRRRTEKATFDELADNMALEGAMEAYRDINIETIMKEYFENEVKEDRHKPKAFPHTYILQAMTDLVEKEDKDAIVNLVDSYLGDTEGEDGAITKAFTDKFMSLALQGMDADFEMEGYVTKLKEHFESIPNGYKKITGAEQASSSNSKDIAVDKRKNESHQEVTIDGDTPSEDEDADEGPSSSKGKGRAKKTASSKGRSSNTASKPRGRGAKSKEVISHEIETDDDEVDVMDDEPAPKSKARSSAKNRSKSGSPAAASSKKKPRFVFESDSD